jgi:hypothetical protein
MRIFWILFIALLLTGTAAIYCYAPRYSSVIIAYVPDWLKPVAPTEGTTTYFTNRVVVTSVPKETAPKTPPKPKPGVPEDESFVSPAMEGIYFARANEHPGWGVTYQKTTYYNEKGAYLGTIESGELLTCLSGKLTSSKGDLLACTVRTNTPSPLFIARKDAYFFTGDYNKLAKKQMQMLSAYYQLTAKIAERRKKILETNASMNPHFESSKAAYTELTKNIKEASQLQTKLPSATGVQKTELDDQLRTLKMKEVVLKKTFETIQSNFVAWKSSHAAQLPRPENDPEINAWQAEKQKLVSGLPGLAF